jgi:hypothetical protein
MLRLYSGDHLCVWQEKTHALTWRDFNVLDLQAGKFITTKTLQKPRSNKARFLV